MNFILQLMIRPLVRALIRLFDGPQHKGDIPVVRAQGCAIPKTTAWPGPANHHSRIIWSDDDLVDIEKLIHDTVARWHGDQFDRRPLAKVLTETLRPYLKKPAGYRPRSGSNDF